MNFVIICSFLVLTISLVNASPNPPPKGKCFSLCRDEICENSNCIDINLDGYCDTCVDVDSDGRCDCLKRDNKCYHQCIAAKEGDFCQDPACKDSDNDGWCDGSVCDATKGNCDSACMDWTKEGFCVDLCTAKKV